MSCHLGKYLKLMEQRIRASQEGNAKSSNEVPSIRSLVERYWLVDPVEREVSFENEKE